ncbi:hypothetical protein Vretifemale_8406, partial [Volvox reticuliferus]
DAMMSTEAAASPAAEAVSAAVVMLPPPQQQQLSEKASAENVSPSGPILGPNWTMTPPSPTPVAIGQQPAAGTEAVSTAPLPSTVMTPPLEAMPPAVSTAPLPSTVMAPPLEAMPPAVSTAPLPSTVMAPPLEAMPPAVSTAPPPTTVMTPPLEAMPTAVEAVAAVPHPADAMVSTEMAASPAAEAVSLEPPPSVATALPSGPLPQLPSPSAAPTPPPGPSTSPTPSVTPSMTSSVKPPVPPPPPSRQEYTDATSAGGGDNVDDTRFHIKSNLLDLVYGTSRGLSATSAQRAAIEELVEGLEMINPNAMATEAVSALGGRWKLVYTSNVATLLLLGALDGMPLVDVGDVVQIIDPEGLTATNKIDLAVPLLVSLRAEAGLEVRSPRQFKVRLTRVGLDTYVATPQLLAALEVPPSITVLGATLDLTPLKKLLEPINSGLEAAQDLLGRAVAPEFLVDSVPVPPGMSRGAVQDVASLWMLTTYLDDTLRISRDDEGRVFVMLKDVGLYPQTDATRSTHFR